MDRLCAVCFLPRDRHAREDFESVPGTLRARIATNFTWGELIRDSDLTQLTGQIEQNLADLVGDVLQPLRDHVARPITVNSGWRDAAKNTLVGGHPTSYHIDGLAADITAPDLADVWDTLIASAIPFDQACVYPTFIHVGIARPGRDPRRFIYAASKGTWTNRRHIPYPEVPDHE